MKLLAHSVHHQVLSVLGLLGVQRVNRFASKTYQGVRFESTFQRNQRFPSSRRSENSRKVQILFYPFSHLLSHPLVFSPRHLRLRRAKRNRADHHLRETRERADDNRPTNRSQDLSYKDKHWHEACFLCNRCRVSLVDKQFGSKVDKIYCGNCYDAQFASRCDGCGEIFRAGT